MVYPYGRYTFGFSPRSSCLLLYSFLLSRFFRRPYYFQLRSNLFSLSSNSLHSYPYPKKIACSSASSLHYFLPPSSLFSCFLFPPFCKKIVLPSLLLPSFLPPVYLSRITRPRKTSLSPSTPIKRHSSSYLIIPLLRSFPLLFIVPSPFVIFSRIFLRRHRSVIRFLSFYPLSFSLSLEDRTRSIRAL